ncbi:MAG TPA: neutral zinc metallopeptidase [Acidimicrobiia bacterium]
MRRLAIVIAAALGVAVLPAPAALAGPSGGNGGEPTLDETSGRAPKPSGDYRDTIADAVADIQTYWADEFPILYHRKYTPIPKDRIIAARPGVKLPPCGGRHGTYSDVEGNASYVGCPGKPFVVYDDFQLFPALDRDFGGLAVPLVLAHEWGHAVQDQARTIDNRIILVELQADCFAGSWLARVANGDAPRVSIKSGDLDSALAAFLSFRDQIGTTEDNTPNAHGSGFDRTSAFQQGFDEGADACAPYFDSPPVIVEIPFTDEQEAASGGNVPADEVIPDAVDMLNDYYSQVEPAYVPKSVDDIYSFDPDKKRDLPSCGGTVAEAKDVDNRVFYCAEDGNFGFDGPYLQHVYDDIGDFGVAALVANPFATYVQIIQQFPGVDTAEDNAVLGADCYTGGFAAALFRGVLLVDPATNDPKFTLSPGDLDEAISAYVDYTHAATARGADPRDLLDVTFVRLRAFRDGFLNGYQTCSSYGTLAQPSG